MKTQPPAGARARVSAGPSGRAIGPLGRAATLAVAASLAASLAPLADAPVAGAAAPSGGAAFLLAQPGGATDATSAGSGARSTGPGTATSESGEATTEPEGPAPGRRGTDDCEFRVHTPPAVDTSEVPLPGSPTPEPLPVPEHPAGGPRMSECGVVVPEGFEVPEPVAASSWLVFDATSGTVVAAKDPHGRYRPASIIKVLLALVAIDELPLDQKLRITHDEAAMEGSRAGLVEGTEYTVETLLLGLLMSSGNDAAAALTRALGGDAAVLAKVNDKAAELGATDTRVANTSGLDGPGQSTSAFDMALFYTEAFNDPVYRRLSSTRLHDMPGDEDAGIEGFTMSNDNQLLASGFEGALGGKTGFTDDARHTFVGVAERGDRRLGAIILDTTVEEGHRAWQQAAALLDEGFGMHPAATVGDLSVPASGEGSPMADFEEDAAVLASFGEGAAQRARSGGIAALAGALMLVIGWRVMRRRR